MTKAVDERRNIEISSTGTLTATSMGSVGILSLLPFVVATSIGGPVGTHGISGTLAEINNVATDVKIRYKPSPKISISEGVEIPTDSLESLFQTFSQDYNAKYTHIEEFGILENLVGNILENSEQQPEELKSLMYDNIDELLI